MTVVASNFERVAFDLYETEEWATDVLLRYFSIADMIIWEPAAGRHKMADVLKRRTNVLTSDVKTYDRRHDFILDFFCNRSYPIVQGIITNPAYGPGNRDAVSFARMALKRCAGLVALLLTAKFDSGKTRVDLFRDNPRFTAKIVLLDRVQWFPGDTGGTEDHAWYVWTAKRPTPFPALFYGARTDAEPYHNDLFGEYPK